MTERRFSPANKPPESVPLEGADRFKFEQYTKAVTDAILELWAYRMTTPMPLDEIDEHERRMADV